MWRQFQIVSNSRKFDDQFPVTTFQGHFDKRGRQINFQGLAVDDV
jgi:hypothetical protein